MKFWLDMTSEQRFKALAGLNVLFAVLILLSQDAFGFFETTFEDASPFFEKLAKDEDKDNLKAIKIRQIVNGKAVPELALNLKNIDGVWNVQEKGGQEFYTADKSQVDRLIKLLPQAKKFVEITGLKEAHKKINTDPGADTIKVVFGGGGADDVLHTVFIGKSAPGGSKTYARLADEDTVYAISGNYNAVLKNTLERWRDKQIFDFKPEQVTGYQTKIPEQPGITAKKEGNDWKIQQPIQMDADPGKVLSLVRKMSNLRAKKIIMDKKEAKKYIGLNPIGQVTAKWSQGGKESVRNLLILKAEYNKPSDPKAKKTIKEYYVTKGNRKEVYVVTPGNIRGLTKDAKNLKKTKKKGKGSGLEDALGSDPLAGGGKKKKKKN